MIDGTAADAAVPFSIPLKIGAARMPWRARRAAERSVLITIQYLIDALARLVEQDPWRADMSVTFGPDFEAVEGGLIGRKDGLAVLNLAPVRLDKVGGF